MPVIAELSALEILDSRGRPTVKTTCRLASGAAVSASVPSGASTGAAEALELRDGDPVRYQGLGCRQAVHHVEADLQEALADRPFDSQQALDHAMLELDGTENKSRLGANAILSVSIAYARATAMERSIPLYRHFADLLHSGHQISTLPRPTINLFSGGKHAGGQMEIQDILLVANGASTVDDALSMTWAVFQSAARLIRDRYGMRMLVADEGGLAPDFPSIESALDLAIESIAATRFHSGSDLSLCVDVAASHFRGPHGYTIADATLSADELIDRICSWVDRYPIVSVEDGLAEDDWPNWPRLRRSLNTKALTLGDDLLATNPTRIERAIESNSANALLLKVNQIGTLTEAAESLTVARNAGWKVVVSARSGETEDDWLADLAVGWQGDGLKVGSITRSERLAKWNRLLEIAQETGLPLNDWPN
ncbi:phosphopyruvate hydratase [soil metagenome]